MMSRFIALSYSMFSSLNIQTFSIIVILGFLRCLSSFCRLFITLALHFLLVTKVSFVNRLPLLCLFSHPGRPGNFLSLLFFTLFLLIPSAVSHLGFLEVVRLASTATHTAPLRLSCSWSEVVFATVLSLTDSIEDEVFLSVVGLNHYDSIFVLKVLVKVIRRGAVPAEVVLLFK